MTISDPAKSEAAVAMGLRFVHLSIRSCQPRGLVLIDSPLRKAFKRKAFKIDVAIFWIGLNLTGHDRFQVALDF